jgi:hypothetical protein
MARSPQQVGVIQRVKVSGSNTVVASPRACLPGHSVILERRLNTVAWDLPDVWDHDMLTPATGFCPMCGMNQCPSPPQAYT